MTLVPYSIENLETMTTRYYKSTKNLRVIDEFIKSDLCCAEITNFDSKNAKSLYGSLYKSIKRFRKEEVAILKRGERLFLVRKSCLDEMN